MIEKILDILLKFDKFQNYVNRKSNIKCGSKIIYNSNNTTIEEVFNDYNFNDIQSSDIVLDIGANVGGFSLFVSKFVKHVYAVEPIMTSILKANVKLNNIHNIIIIDDALGNKINWGGIVIKSHGKSLSQLISLCGGHIDFLKCDCEGGEWSIKPEELKGIRRIEIEVHNFDGTHNLEDFLKILDKSGFEYEYIILKDFNMIVHANRTQL